MTPLGSISGNVSEDTDNDDIGEEPLSGVTIMLLDCIGGMVSATETDALSAFLVFPWRITMRMVMEMSQSQVLLIR